MTEGPSVCWCICWFVPGELRVVKCNEVRTTIRFASRNVRRTRIAIVTHVGSTLVTNAAIRRPPNIAPRHQFDHAFHCPELRSVDFTVAANDNPVLRSVDATACRKKTAKLASVRITSFS